MNIKFNIYKYFVILILFFFTTIIKTTAQNNVNLAKTSNLSLASLAIISGIEWENEKLIPKPAMLKMDNNSTKNKKSSIHFIDTSELLPEPSILLSDLLNFSVIVSNNSAILQWKASNLSDAQELIVEQSIDGTFFQEVSVIMMDVEEKINGLIIPQENGLSYYRLKVLDKDGSTAYTEPLTCQVDTKASGIVSVYPNSINDEWLTALSVVTDYRGKIKVVITDDHGHQLIEFHREIVTEQSKIPIGVATIPKGAYYIFVSMKDGSHIGSVQELVKN
ncbi:hypothetical protein F0919_13190 [Taibaiella lutea]|uniref:T9SS type A sorting domain-containing protein n=1 Tax=Taibaiella lutea TaxID=2608001 RepID=A0A5M6CGC5_9BACT|nr:hypothetical protein [Taibaiella lutea]KAA5533490.1 hypothetical protein F0919_13190 [Taibaiella lutea]